MYDFVKDLIKIRKKIGAFKWTKPSDIKNSLFFIDDLDEHIIAYKIKFFYKTYYFIINALDKEVDINQNMRDRIFGLDKSLVKIFNQKGIINKRLSVSDVKKICKLSANIYVKGEKNGL